LIGQSDIFPYAEYGRPPASWPMAIIFYWGIFILLTVWATLGRISFSKEQRLFQKIYKLYFLSLLLSKADVRQDGFL